MKILILTGNNEYCNLFCSNIQAKFSNTYIVREESTSKLKILKKRIKRKGIIFVLNQLLFQILICKFLFIISRKRLKFLKYKIEKNNFEFKNQFHVNNINSESSLKHILNIKPDLIIVFGTRIIKKHIIDSINCSIVNLHFGITPHYRGVHGAYWALVNNDFLNCGVTLHNLDYGIDTGNIIFQKSIVISKYDNFITYPLIQLDSGLKIIFDYVLNYNIYSSKKSQKNKVKGMLYSHPTFTLYLKNLILNNVK
jgi:formyltetrahydrofolate hydrolase